MAFTPFKLFLDRKERQEVPPQEIEVDGAVNSSKLGGSRGVITHNFRRYDYRVNEDVAAMELWGYLAWIEASLGYRFASDYY